MSKMKCADCPDSGLRSIRITSLANGGSHSYYYIKLRPEMHRLLELSHSKKSRNSLQQRGVCSDSLATYFGRHSTMLTADVLLYQTLSLIVIFFFVV
jgi:hypothetical protein